MGGGGSGVEPGVERVGCVYRGGGGKGKFGGVLGLQGPLSLRAWGDSVVVADGFSDPWGALFGL